MSMATPDRDPGLDTLLDLHGQTLFVDEIGHWVKFIVLRTEAGQSHFKLPLIIPASSTRH